MKVCRIYKIYKNTLVTVYYIGKHELIYTRQPPNKDDLDDPDSIVKWTDL